MKGHLILNLTEGEDQTAGTWSLMYFLDSCDQEKKLSEACNPLSGIIDFPPMNEDEVCQKALKHLQKRLKKSPTRCLGGMTSITTPSLNDEGEVVKNSFDANKSFRIRSQFVHDREAFLAVTNPKICFVKGFGPEAVEELGRWVKIV